MHHLRNAPLILRQGLLDTVNARVNLKNRIVKIDEIGNPKTYEIYSSHPNEP